jgi:hypothetical protein
MAKEFSLVLIGSGLMDEAQIFMTGRPDQDRIMPLSIKYSEDETSVELVFPASELVQGSYDITVINPGGFRTVYHGFRSGFRQAVDINISLGYAPVIPLYGYLFNTYSSPFYPAGFYGRAQVIPYKQSWGFIGAELTPQLGIMKTKTGSHTVDGTMMGFALDAVYQWWFNKRIMALNFRLGGGLVGIFGIKFAHADGSASRSVATILPVVNAGVSFEWIIWRNLFIDAGFEYAQTFSSHSPPPGFIRISAGAGWRF